MAAAQAGNRLKENFSPRAFGQGLAIAALLYALVAAWIFFNAGKTAEEQLEKLASQTVIVEWKTPPAPDTEMLVQGPPNELAAPPETAPEQQQPQQQEAAPVPYAPEILESGLAKAPLEGLYETTPLGQVPKVRATDGLTPFMAYRRPFDLQASDAPLISLAITGLGLSDVATESAVRAMPADVSFIMSPYAAAPDFWINEARSRGHEVWLTVPMESKNYPEHDPGPHTMLIGAPERENLAKMDWLLTRGAGYIGFVTSYQPEFMQSVNDMRPIVGNIYQRGLAFVDGSAGPGITPQTMAAGMKAPYSTVDIWIDLPDASPQAIEESLKRLEQIAQEKGVAVGVINALPVSYQKVLPWLESLSGKGLRLAPLSASTGF